MVVIPNEEQIMWMMANADDTHAPAIVISCILCGVLSLVFVLLRLYSRFITKLGIQASDWLVIVALIFSFALDASLACTTLFGNGRHVIFATDHRMLAILTITDEIFYGFSITFIKLGVLALYMNLFPPTRFRYAIWTAVAMVSGWMISLFFAAIFHCNPIAYNWDQTIEGAYCIDGGIASSTFGIANIATDFVILLLPIPSVIALKLSRQKKILAIFTFVMGGSACIISIVRVPYTLWLGASWDITYDQYHAAILTSTELTAGILVTSIPTYLPLIRKCTGRSFDRTNSNQNKQPLQGFGFNGLATIGSSGFRQKSGDSDKSAGHSSVTMAVIDVELATHGLIPDEVDSTYKKTSQEQLYKTSENSSYHSR